MSEDVLITTTRIVAAFVSKNNLRVEDLGALLEGFHSKLVQATLPEPVAQEPTPVIPWRKTIHRDYLVSLEDGKKYKTLKRHLTRCGMTLNDYREKWGLPEDYPEICAEYSDRRSALAKALGLGHARAKKRKVSTAAEAAIEEKVAPAKTAPVPVNSTRVPNPRSKPRDRSKKASGASGSALVAA